MFYLTLYLKELLGVHDIQMHKLTTTQGRYNITTNKKWFATVTEMIQSNLQAWVDGIKSKHDINLHRLPSATIKQKPSTKEQESEGNGSYLSACSSVFTFDEGSTNEPPNTSGSVPSLGQLHYQFHPQWTVPLKTALVTSPEKSTIVLPATMLISPMRYKNSANKSPTSSRNNNTINPTPSQHPITHTLPCKAPTTILARYSLPKSPQLWHKYKMRPLNHNQKPTNSLQQVSQNPLSAELSWTRASTQLK